MVTSAGARNTAGVANTVGTVHVIVPETLHDLSQSSGGNVYDLRIMRGLAAAGWTVREHPVPGFWPQANEPTQSAQPDQPGARAAAALARALASVEDGQLLLVDGLIGCAMPQVLVPAARRLRLVLLVHVPLSHTSPGGREHETAAREAAVLAAADAVITTSRWTRNELLDRYPLSTGRVHVAAPGVDVSGAGHPSDDGTELLCVAAVAPAKGHDVLVAALAELADLSWRLTCVGPLDRDPSFVAKLTHQLTETALADRVTLLGALPPATLAERYLHADVLIQPSRVESYGMACIEALAAGLPVIASSVGGMPEALGTTDPDVLPGLLIPPEDPAALAGAIRGWLSDRSLRIQLRRAALRRRDQLPSWQRTTDQVEQVLSGVLTAALSEVLR